MTLASIPELLAELRAGRPVILVDDENRENEGDLLMPAATATPEWVNFMAREGRGLICVTLTPDRARVLDLTPMVGSSTDPNGTAFTVSVDHVSNSTGISAFDRAATIAALMDDAAKPADFRRPGHIFPLVARPGGVLRRAGHTEAGCDLARLAGFAPVGVICEIMNDSGEMSRLPDLLAFGERHGLKVGSIEALIAYRMEHDPFMQLVAEARLPTEYGEFRLVGFEDTLSGAEHVALVMGDVTPDPLLVRVHSECLTGDGFHSLRCDCGPQRDAAMQAIAAEGRGVLVYLRQEGRGIGLLNKIRAYHLQDGGADTVEANLQLGFPADARDFGIGAQMLHLLGARQLRVLTNNPRKLHSLGGFGLEVVERVPLHAGHNEHNTAYLSTKAAKLGHIGTDGSGD
ncbi:bifunctional 3,4-dihydroxy-2-butanone-4-phosphate synthase/GTP cyclohydrolase II [Deinococcus soli (ex Cha et al. 2016)]|uniref:Riboflavin biosynthesis protein RibBA n=2 Tax=Deinococcus soli (ex Cha et al. 2016) TaxID=1309411 RepID=A0AAE3XF29_9DEIO|nr:bifunctional 3,4-dihydroxy-2-butanone-4-phosphate synthase/GTP cyclohydrolase II [Deinococcus soli (ex Cha et al. 2016)]MDR6219779.1 3,4-dihydroxy 2-butanone 4-phosphate synthase/GTP cyclohydrolase II [Deinococcus soli (ex Cha et al. 2016)]MDR6329621.1 3,4-dihydroxy 2-butanone 4-phosphate synthase/GTP cyclohydrolase II [Deinococcus soli (ex Cha et al. 2016)]MDR6752686.1 3,4-dihydroxy 2-butanone 4-phosphate synthase/GTP cyclohydrolase II [Deinococcus soli (ex Cha et al. 2016)]